MRRILNYPGSKWRMADLIIKQFPEHKSYLEPYFGSGAVFFNKPKDILETINDLDGRIVNLFKQIRERPQELSYFIHMTPYSREEYQLSERKSANDLEDARRMLVRCWFAIGGKTNAMVGWRRNISWNGPYNTYDWSNIPAVILDAAERLKDAQIEHKDAVILIEEMNDRDMLIYADPPYLNTTRSSKHYSNEMDEAEHLKLIDTLKNHEGPVILSGYDSEIYRDSLKDWQKVYFETRVGINNQNKKIAKEVLWMNFEPNGQIDLMEYLEE
ncbi:DNA adenine methylase [Marinilactibacillus sp. XAAS-LB27]|uniref:DNA adenine methylase n=1 Tax=Marinilactibacillus sp. XAAS-LB27 TaxID=3114538 RepID=UPI002E19A78C|nr:DNA adenine methylase [Marinilactibacillus sp. XAAS-LB27]